MPVPRTIERGEKKVVSKIKLNSEVSADKRFFYFIPFSLSPFFFPVGGRGKGTRLSTRVVDVKDLTKGWGRTKKKRKSSR